MSNEGRKYPQWLQWLIRIIILAAALLVVSNRIDGSSYEGIFTYQWHHPWRYIPLFCILWGTNLLLDARIWQQVHDMLGKIKLLRALKTNLVCYTLSFITPVNSGELAGRYIMIEASMDRRKTVFLTFWSHFPRLIVKICLGALAFLILAQFSFSKHPWLIIIIGLIILLALLAYFNFVRLQRWLAQLGWRRFAFAEYLLVERPVSTEKLRLLVLATLKFLTYNLQFLTLLLLWGNVEFSTLLMASIVALYVLGAFIPTLPMADFLVKAGIALVIFNSVPIDDSLLVNATLVTWLFNLAIPSLVGGIIIFRTDLMDAIRRKPLSGNLYDL